MVSKKEEQLHDNVDCQILVLNETVSKRKIKAAATVTETFLIVLFTA